LPEGVHALDEALGLAGIGFVLVMPICLILQNGLPLLLKSVEIMAKVVLEINNPKDWQVLLPLLERLKIQFTQVDAAPTSQDMDQTNVLEIIKAGLPAFDNFDEWIRQFEENRKDRPLPFRGN